mgnify:CR=1 FL=1
MKKKIFLAILSVLIIAGLTACSTAEKDVEGTTESTVTTTVVAESITEKETTTSESTTNKSKDSDTTTKPAEQKSAGQTTTKKVTTTQKQTTTQRQTTTKKVTTTQKPTTTQKVTTTAAPYWCDEGGTHHSCEVGQIGWVNSYDEASDKAYEYLASHNETGNFRVKECHNCGKFTAKITFD